MAQDRQRGAKPADPTSPHARRSSEAAPATETVAGQFLDRAGVQGWGRGPAQAAMVLRLQRLYGNNVVQRFLQRVARPGGPVAAGAAGPVAATVSAMLPSETVADPSYAGRGLAALPSRGPFVVQRSLTGSFPTSFGGFEMGMETQLGAVAGTGPSGLKGTIKFVPGKGLTYSNKIGLIQVVKLTGNKGANVDPVSLPATTGPHVRTTEDKAKGVEGGFFTDVLHNDPFITKKAKGPGDDLPPYYPFSSGGGQIFGFKRSDDPADSKAAELFDFPGTTSKTAELDFHFETVAKGDDTGQVYGAVKWSFGLRKGSVVDEAMTVSDGESATFDAALEKHRDFYIHEPVTFYFGFDKDTLQAGEAAKIDTFLDYLRRFPDVRINLTGFADQRGNVAYNDALALRRAKRMVDELVGKGVDKGRINAPATKGATTDFTKDAITKQDAEANRRGNRRVMLNFEHTASIVPK